jgi:hypothetical protein
VRLYRSIFWAFFIFSELAQASPRLFFSPLAPVLGTGVVGVDYRISRISSLGPALTFYEFRDGAKSADGYALGAQWEFFVSHDVYTDSWILTPKVSSIAATRSGKSVWGISSALLLGYTWFWPSGFNLRLGVEGEYMSLDFQRIGVDHAAFQATGHFGIGYYY